MNSKHEIYLALQRVANDMHFKDDNLKPIAFIEVAKMLARIGQEPNEPDLVSSVNALCKLIAGDSPCSFYSFYGDNNLVFQRMVDGIESMAVIANTKEQLFYTFLGYIANESKVSKKAEAYA